MDLLFSSICTFPFFTRIACTQLLLQNFLFLIFSVSFYSANVFPVLSALYLYFFHSFQFRFAIAPVFECELHQIKNETYTHTYTYTYSSDTQKCFETMHAMQWKHYVKDVLNALCYGKYSMHTDNIKNATNNTFPYTVWKKWLCAYNFRNGENRN